MNINTVQSCLKVLLKENLIEVADIVYSGTVLSRSYRPLISRDEYFNTEYKDIIGTSSTSSLIAAFIKEEQNASELERLEQIIQKEEKRNRGNTLMEISFGPFLTCFFCNYVSYNISLYYFYTVPGMYLRKILSGCFLGILLIFIRLSVPVNFPFTYSVYSEKFLPRFTNPLCDNKIGNLSIYDCLLIL